MTDKSRRPLRFLARRRADVGPGAAGGASSASSPGLALHALLSLVVLQGELRPKRDGAEGVQEAVPAKDAGHAAVQCADGCAAGQRRSRGEELQAKTSTLTS